MLERFVDQQTLQLFVGGVALAAVLGAPLFVSLVRGYLVRIEAHMRRGHDHATVLTTLGMTQHKHEQALQDHETRIRHLEQR